MAYRKSPAYLWQHSSGLWYFKRPIPPDLQKHFIDPDTGKARTHIVRSVRTHSRHEAEKLKRPHASEADALFRRYRGGGPVRTAAESAYALMTGGDSLMTPGATANTENRTLWKTPSAIVSGRLINALPTVTGMLGAGTTTSREFNDLWRALPGSRLYGMPALGNYFADAFPRSEPSPAD